jgi:hypothetical protein
MNDRVKGQLRVEVLSHTNGGRGYQKPQGRVWIDITVDGQPAQSQVWFSGDLIVAERIFTGDAVIRDGEVIEVKPTPAVDDGLDDIMPFTGQLNPTPHW